MHHTKIVAGAGANAFPMHYVIWLVHDADAVRGMSWSGRAH